MENWQYWLFFVVWFIHIITVEARLREISEQTRRIK